MHAIPRLLVLLTALAAPATALPATGMQPGLWELAITVEIRGQKHTVPTARACIAQADIDDPIRTLPRPEGDCVLSNVQRTSERATYDLVCTLNAITSRGQAQIDYAGDRYDGKVEMVMSGKDVNPLRTLMVLSALRVGECSK